MRVSKNKPKILTTMGQAIKEAEKICKRLPKSWEVFFTEVPPRYYALLPNDDEPCSFKKFMKKIFVDRALCIVYKHQPTYFNLFKPFKGRKDMLTSAEEEIPENLERIMSVTFFENPFTKHLGAYFVLHDELHPSHLKKLRS